MLNTGASIRFAIFLTFLAQFFDKNRAQSTVTYGGRIPIDKTDDVATDLVYDEFFFLAPNVEIRHDMIIRGFEYFDTRAEETGGTFVTFFKLANCTKDCANYINKHPYLNKEDTNVVPIRLPFLKNGYSKYTIEDNLAFYVPKGSIIAIDYSELAIEVSGRAPRSDLYIPDIFSRTKRPKPKGKFLVRDDPVDFFEWPILLYRLDQVKNFRLLVNTWGNPIDVINSVSSIGVNLNNNWNDNLIENYHEWGARYVVANIEIPKNTLVTGFEIHATTAGLVSLNFVSFKNCMKASSCAEYLDTVAASSAILNDEQDIYYSYNHRIDVELKEGLNQVQLAVAMYKTENHLIVLEQDYFGGRVSIDTSSTVTSRSDFMFNRVSLTGHMFVKLSQNNQNWRFMVRASVKKFRDATEWEKDPTSSANGIQRSLTLISILLMASFYSLLD